MTCVSPRVIRAMRYESIVPIAVRPDCTPAHTSALLAIHDNFVAEK